MENSANSNTMDSKRYLIEAIGDFVGRDEIISSLVQEIKIEEFFIFAKAISVTDENFDSTKFYNIILNIKKIVSILSETIPSLAEKAISGNTQGIYFEIFIKILFNLRNLMRIEISRSDAIVVWHLWNNSFPIQENKLYQRIAVENPEISQEAFFSSIGVLNKIKALHIEDGLISPIEKLEFSSLPIPRQH
jgi:hypothetical protein